MTGRCDWAGCKEPTAGSAGGWEHCAKHLRQHARLSAPDPEPRTRPALPLLKPASPPAYKVGPRPCVHCAGPVVRPKGARGHFPKLCSRCTADPTVLETSPRPCTDCGGPVTRNYGSHHHFHDACDTCRAQRRRAPRPQRRKLPTKVLVLLTPQQARDLQQLAEWLGLPLPGVLFAGAVTLLKEHRQAMSASGEGARS